MGTSSGERLEKGGLPEGTAPDLSIMGEEARASCRARPSSAEESLGQRHRSKKQRYEYSAQLNPSPHGPGERSRRRGRLGRSESCLPGQILDLTGAGSPWSVRGSLVVHSGSV